jgi:oligopeptide/dipeptide ABC transporter ATP-binding protein
MDKDEANETALALLQSVGIPEPAQRLEEYPHQLSGGMRQRVTIAIALACGPKILFADEPTTALDVTVQAQILNLLQKQQSERHMAMILVTHDLGVVAGRTDDIAVMYAGKIVEEGTADDIYYRPMMPYTWGLLKSLPRLGHDTDRLTPISGAPPSLIFLPDGCSFSPRCPYVFDECRVVQPDLLPIDGHHAARCHLSLEDRERIVAQEILATS